MVGACKMRARFLEEFICCLFERTASEISSIKPCFCHSVRNTVHLRKALFDISKESEMKIIVQDGFQGKGKMYKNLKFTCKPDWVERVS